MWEYTIMPDTLTSACRFMWSVHRSMLIKTGSELPDTGITWHMGKPSAPKSEKKLIICCQLVCTISPIAEYNFLDHLVEPVSNAVTIMLSDLLRREVGGDDGEKLFFVTLCQQVDDWSIDITIVHYL